MTHLGEQGGTLIMQPIVRDSSRRPVRDHSSADGDDSTAFEPLLLPITDSADTASRGTDRHAAPADAERRSLSPAGWWCLAALVAGVLFVLPLSVPFPLVDPDEGLHAAIAQEMLETGDFITPRFCGQPFFDKPGFYFWCQALGLKLCGMNEAGIRLPGLLFGLLGVVTTGLLAGVLFGRFTGLLAGLIHATTALPLIICQAAVHDVALVPWTTLTLLAFWMSARAATRRSATGWSFAAGLALGVSILVKGLLGAAIVCVAYTGYLIVSRRLTVGRVAGIAAALGLGFIVASPWYIAMSLRHPDFAYYYFVERHLGGYLTDDQPHGDEAWWYYLPIFFVGTLPWIGYLPALLCERLGGDDEGRRPRLFLWCWLFGGLLFLSVAHSKLVTYLMPVFPVVPILVADLWNRFLTGRVATKTRSIIAATAWTLCMTGAVAAPLTFWVLSEMLGVKWGLAVHVLTGLIALGTLLPLAWWQRRPERVLQISFGVLAAGFFVALKFGCPPVAEVHSARRLAGYINAEGHAAEHIVVVDERIGSLVFYLSPSLRRRVREEGIRQVTRAEFSQWTGLPRRTVVAVPEKVTAEWFPSFLRFEDGDVRGGVQVGHYDVYDPAVPLRAAACH